MLSATKSIPNDQELKKRIDDVKVVAGYRVDFENAMKENDHETALRKLDVIIDKCSHAREWIIHKIKILADLGRINDALELVKKHQSEFASFSDFMYVTGLVYIYKGNT